MSVRSGVGLVSGAAAAPGAAFARELATRCERILLLTRRPDEVRSLARELEGQDIPITAAHFQGMQFGRLLAAQGQRRWVFD